MAAGRVSGEPIIRIDDVTVAPGRRERFLDLLRSDYVPAAQARGLTLVDVALAPPVDLSDRETDVVLTWHLRDVGAFWNARRAAMADARGSAFWQSTASLVTRRSRRYARSSVNSHPMAPEPGAVPSSGGVHHIVLLALPVDDAWGVEGPPGASTRSVGRHLPGSVGEVDASWELDADHSLAVNELVINEARVLDVVVLGTCIGIGVRATALHDGIKRTLLLRVEERAARAAVAAFERDLLAMPHYIPSIRNWRLSRVERSGGGWTHAWEQEYEHLSGLLEDYMHSPFHWGVVDGWFDAEDPRCIVAPELLHLFYEVPASILACT